MSHSNTMFIQKGCTHVHTHSYLQTNLHYNWGSTVFSHQHTATSLLQFTDNQHKTQEMAIFKWTHRGAYQ